MAPKTTVAHCPSCRAPLRWLGTAEVVECRYCSAHVYVGEPTADRPEHGTITQLPATHTTLIRPARVVASSLIGAVVFGGIAVGAALYMEDRMVDAATSKVPAASATTSSKRATPSTLRTTIPLTVAAAGALPVDQSAEALAAAAGDGVIQTNAGDTYQSVNVAVEGPWNDWRFEWRDGKPFVTSVTITASEGGLPEGAGKRMVAQLKQLLGYAPASQSVANDAVGVDLVQGGQLQFSASGKKLAWRLAAADTGGKERRLAVLRVLAQLVQGKVSALTPEQRVTLGLGPRLASVGKASIALRSSQVVKTYSTWLPGIRQFRTAYYTLAVDHPWIAEVDFYVEDKPDGGMESIHFRLRQKADPSVQQKLHGCLVKVLGEPRTRESKTLTETKVSHTWKSGPVQIMLNLGSFYLVVRRSKASRLEAWQPTWEALTAAVDACPGAG